MKFCTKCGNKLELLKAPPWTHRYRCTCGVRYEVVHGDKMGGAEDTMIQYNQPFKDEENK